MAQAASRQLLGPTGQPIRRDRKQSHTQKTLRDSLKYLQLRPRKIGDGPTAFSLTISVDHQPFRWDSNQFYGRLGVEPDAERVEIARAYQDAPRPTQQADLYYTTAAKTLLKKDERRRYDALQLGMFWGNDPGLDDARIDTETGEGLEQFSPLRWAHYADPCVTEVEATSWDSSEIRTGLVRILSRWATRFDDPRVAVGVTRTEPRWEQMGAFPVLFVGVDECVTEEYLVRVANEFIAATDRS